MSRKPKGPKQALGERVEDLALPLLGGGRASLAAALEGKAGVAVLFWSGVCSHCRRYDGYLTGFAERHPEVALLVVACRDGETADDLAKTVAERALGFPLLLDADRAAAHRWLVAQTPRVFLVDRRQRLLYRGAIDNFKYPADPEHQPYLEEAIAALLAGRPVPRPETPSFGCPIESVYYSLEGP